MATPSSSSSSSGDGSSSNNSSSGEGGKEGQVAAHSLASAQACLLQRNYGRAFAHYLLVLKLAPERKPEVKESFTMALREWSETLERTGRIQDLFKCYQQACELFPECETMLNNMGAQLFRLNYIDEAACCFRRALKIDPDFLGARENLENVCSHLVERWHFRMLNDVQRNQKFKEAIQRAVQAGHQSVLDIGTGTGLLSMITVQAGARHVYGCEMSKTMYELACDIVAANQTADRIRLLHKKSTDMSIPMDIPQRVSLVVTETFDAGLLGEHILPTLHHAWENLLVTEPALGIKPQVLPEGATVFICAIESTDIRRQNRLLYPALRYLDFSELSIVCRTSMTQTRPDEDREFDPYSTERLDLLSGSYKRLTHVLPAFHINFNDKQEVASYVKGISRDLTLSIIQHGRVDAIAMWFDLNLDSQVSLSSAPDSNSCWEQAIYPVLPAHLDASLPGFCGRENFLVRKGDSVKLNCGCRDSTLFFHVTGITRLVKSPSVETMDLDPVLSHSSSNPVLSHQTPNSSKPFIHHSSSSPTLNSGRSSHYLPPSPSLTFCLERHALGRLNDIDINTAYCTALEKLKKSHFHGQTLTVLDLTQGFSPLPLQALKLGAREVCTTETNVANQELLCCLATANGIEPHQVIFGSRHFEESEEEWGVLVTELVEPCGCLRQQVLEDIALARVTCLKSHSVVVPHSAAVYAMIIESDMLLNDTAVIDDEVTLGFRVAEFMNDFQMTTHVDIELSTLKYKKLCEPFELFTFNFNEPPASNALPSYLDQSKTLKVIASDTGQVTAVLYWFELLLTQDLKICTLDPKMHWKQAAVMHRGAVVVSTGTTLNVKAVCKSSVIDISVSLA